MANMRTLMPALQRAMAGTVSSDGLHYANVTTPKQQRQTRIVKDMPTDEVARELVHWITQE
jgi:electron transfer flavoprotein beta subunit